MGKVLEATEGFVADIDGERFIVNRRTTRVDAEHPLAKRYPNFFRAVDEDLSFPIEAATDNPGESRERPAPTRRPVPQARPAQKTPEKENTKNG